MFLLPHSWSITRLLTLLAMLFASQSVSVQASPQPLRTVFLIVMENHSWPDIQGSSSAPYINKTLLPVAARADHYFTPPHLHPSLPNYLWLEAGTNFGITSDITPTQGHQRSTSHLTTLLYRAHIPWKAYEQGIAGTVCPLQDSGNYAVRHDPMVYFDDVTHRNDPQSRYCISHIRPYTQLFTDLHANRVARYTFITPDVCNDMHDACGPMNNPIRQGDLWLSKTVPAILASAAFRAGGVLIITWDEGTGDSDGPLVLLAISPNSKRGYVSHLSYTHSSTLRTVEETFGLKSMLGGAAHSNDLSDMFTRFP